MGQRSQQMVHDFIYGKKARNGSDYRQITVNGWKQMSYDSKTIWSYNTILARINREKNYIVMHEETRDCYGPTTREHYDSLENAIPGHYKVYYKNSIENVLNEVDNLLKLQARARLKDYSNEILTKIQRLYDYLELIKYDKRKKDYRSIEKRVKLIGLNKKNLKESILEIEAKYKKQVEKARRKQNRLYADRRQKELNKFLETDTIKYDPDFIGVRLKVKDGILYTNNYVQVPEKEARIIYKRYVSGKTILGMKLQEYKVVVATKNQVKIGCTTICRQELDRVLGVN